jgi:uncharacterized membrane protein
LKRRQRRVAAPEAASKTDGETASRKVERGLLAVTLLAATLFAVLDILKLRAFQYQLDTAVVSNVVWRLSHGYDSVTALTGFAHLADHPSLLLFLLVPVSWATGPWLVQTLFVLQALSVAMVSWFVWRFARARGLGPLVSGVVYAVTLVGAGSWFAATGEFHILDLALGPLAAALADWELLKRRRALLWATLAASARLEVAIVVLVAGLILPRSRRWWCSLTGIGLGVGGAIALVGVLSGYGGVGIAAHFGHLGSSPGEVLGTAVSHPLKALAPLSAPSMWRSVFFWAASFGLLPVVLGAKWLIPSLPVLVIPVFGSWAPADSYFEHYWHILLVFGAFAAVEGLVRLRLPSPLSAAVLALPALLVWAILGPLSANLPGDWRVGVPRSDPGLADVEQALPPLDYVVVPLQMTPSVSLRAAVSYFPRPYSCTGVENLLPSTPAYRESGPPVVVVATSAWPERDDPVWEALRAAYVLTRESGSYEVWRLRDESLAQRAMVSCPLAAPTG